MANGIEPLSSAPTGRLRIGGAVFARLPLTNTLL